MVTILLNVKEKKKKIQPKSYKLTLEMFSSLHSELCLPNTLLLKQKEIFFVFVFWLGLIKSALIIFYRIPLEEGERDSAE